VFVNKYPIRNSKSMILNFTAVRQLHCRYYDNFTPTNVGTSFEFVLNAEISDFGYSLREAEIHAEPTAWQLTPRSGN